MAAREHFAGYTGDVLVLPAMFPLVSAGTLEAFISFIVTADTEPRC